MQCCQTWRKACQHWRPPTKHTVTEDTAMLAWACQLALFVASFCFYTPASCKCVPHLSFMSLHCFIWSALSGIYVFSLGFLSAFDHSCYSPIPHPKTTILIKSAREGEKEGEGQAAQCCCKKVILEKAERRHTTCY